MCLYYDYHLKGRNYEVWMRSCPFFCRTATPGFHVLTGCGTMLSLPGKGKNTCRKMFIKYAHRFTGEVRCYNVDDAWVFVCLLHKIGEKNVRGIDDARHSLFVKVQRDLEVLPVTYGASLLYLLVIS